ncbi:MAG: hypothetical protein JST35_01835 [Armatimonadetes bacterium]|nr:hypothetical protein [Armatimonadota bacterium]
MHPQKRLQDHPGAWFGMSIQEGIRIAEKITLSFGLDSIEGLGTDSDGDFTVDGEYDPSTESVMLVRRYTYSPKNPSQVGYPFIYRGKWDGYCVHGRWMMSTNPGLGGEFEMWPEQESEFEEQMKEYSQQMREAVAR